MGSCSRLQKRIEQSGFGSFIKQLYPEEKVQKITINAGTSCPNRDGTKGRGGCTFCLNKAFSPAYSLGRKSVVEQLHEGKNFFARKYKSMKYLAYFQTYTSTYQDIDSVIDQYQQALSVPDVIGLVVSTRPDCMPDEILIYLHSISQEYIVIIEYGLESTSNTTLSLINRGHSVEEAHTTILKTAEYGLHIGVHLILGLPDETVADVIHHAQTISQWPIDLVKLHQLQILKGTGMESLYATQPERFMKLTPDLYADLCLLFVSHLRENIHLDRFVSQSPPEIVIAPEWNIKNFEFHHLLIKKAAMLSSKALLY